MSINDSLSLHRLSAVLSNKFNGDRSKWFTAKVHLLSKLGEEGLIHYIDRRFDEIPASIRKETEATKCWSIIISRLSDNALTYIVTAMTGIGNERDPFIAWNLLLKKYEEANVDLVMTVQSEIDNTVMEEGERFDDYKTKLDLQFQKLSSMVVFKNEQKENH